LIVDFTFTQAQAEEVAPPASHKGARLKPSQPRP
jgi:hypothetical protein